MNNNAILKKVMISHCMRHEDVEEAFALAGAEVGGSDLRGFLAGSSNKNFIPLSDALLEKFLDGVVFYARGPKEEPHLLPRGIENYIIAQIEAGNDAVLDEIDGLINDVQDARQECGSE